MADNNDSFDEFLNRAEEDYDAGDIEAAEAGDEDDVLNDVEGGEDESRPGAFVSEENKARSLIDMSSIANPHGSIVEAPTAARHHRALRLPRQGDADVVPGIRHERHRLARPAGRARRLEAGSPPHPVRHERVRLHAEPPAHEIGPYGRRRHRQVPPRTATPPCTTRWCAWPAVRPMRVPLVDGHGNFGSIDGDGAAAMRYTESRLDKVAMELLRDLDKETVDFQPNYDESLEEPTVLPARFPNLLVNGSQGIAVGMATNIPPHNLGETIDATCLMLDNPDVTTEELMKRCPARTSPLAA